MSNLWDEDDQQQTPTQNAPKVLRELHDKDRETITKLQEQVTKLTDQLNRKSVSDLLVTKGIDPAAADLAVAAGVEPTTESVEAWLTKYGKFFPAAGSKPDEPTTAPSVPSSPPETVVTPQSQAAQKIFEQSGGQTSTPPDSNNLAEQIARANTSEELDALIANARKAGGGW